MGRTSASPALQTQGHLLTAFSFPFPGPHLCLLENSETIVFKFLVHSRVSIRCLVPNQRLGSSLPWPSPSPGLPLCSCLLSSVAIQNLPRVSRSWPPPWCQITFSKIFASFFFLFALITFVISRQNTRMVFQRYGPDERSLGCSGCCWTVSLLPSFFSFF